MAIVLSKVFAGLMSVVVMISGMFPALFGGKEYVDPSGENVSVGCKIYFSGIDGATVITDCETALTHFGEEENGKYDEDFFEKSNLVVIPVTLTNLACKVFVESVAVKNDKVFVNYSVVRDTCFGATVMSSEIILIEVDKDVEKVKAFEKKITVPFCVHNFEFSYDV